MRQGDKVISPWHDLPLEAGDGMYNMLTEIPKMTLKKMEVATKVEGNPIMQDEKKGKARLYHGPIFWNYGCLCAAARPDAAAATRRAPLPARPWLRGPTRVRPRPPRRQAADVGGPQREGRRGRQRRVR